MKVAAYLRDEFTAAHREQIAVILDGARLDRLATRDECKEFLETYGNQWKAVLEMQFAEYVKQDLEDLL